MTVIAVTSREAVSPHGRLLRLLQVASRWDPCSGTGPTFGGNSTWLIQLKGGDVDMSISVSDGIRGTAQDLSDLRAFTLLEAAGCAESFRM